MEFFHEEEEGLDPWFATGFRFPEGGKEEEGDEPLLVLRFWFDGRDGEEEEEGQSRDQWPGRPHLKHPVADPAVAEPAAGGAGGMDLSVCLSVCLSVLSGYGAEEGRKP